MLTVCNLFTNQEKALETMSPKLGSRFFADALRRWGIRLIVFVVRAYAGNAFAVETIEWGAQ